MPILRHADSPVQQPWAGVSSKGVVRKEVGAERLTVNEITLAPGAAIPLHIHPTHEEAIVIVEGQIEATLGDAVQRISGGHTVLAPTGVQHMLRNVGTTPARILAIFPTTEPQRQLL